MGCKSRFHVDIMDIHDRVTGSCHSCVVTFPGREKLRFLVDCGLFQGEEPQEYNRNFPINAKEISFCLVTHNHVDHTGRLPLLARNGFCGSIYATETTCDFLPKALTDSFSVMLRNTQKGGNELIYSEQDIYSVLEFCVPCDYNETIQVHEYVEVNFLQNNHVPGASMILVRIHYPEYEDINILFTGDYNNKNIFLEDVVIPQWVYDLPITIIQESTYGSITNLDEEEPCFDRNVLKAVEEGWTSLLLTPSFARAQEILYRLKCLQINGLLDQNVPIYLDGKLSISYTSMFLEGFARMKEDMLNFLPENCTFVDKPLRNILLHEDNSCKIIVTSAGMGSYGPARSYIPAYIGRKNMLIHFNCYVAEGTMGRKIKSVPHGGKVKVAGFEVIKQAKVEYTSEFSSHARADTMIDFLKRFVNLKLVLLNHGEEETKKVFAQKIQAEVNCKHVDILDRATAFRINSWGLLKKHPSNLLHFSKECPWGEVRTDPMNFI